ncbi:MAG: hypothetical protein WC379_05825 [Methanoregula sp.]
MFKIDYHPAVIISHPAVSFCHVIHFYPRIIPTKMVLRGIPIPSHTVNPVMTVGKYVCIGRIVVMVIDIHISITIVVIIPPLFYNPTLPEIFPGGPAL